MKDFLKKIAYMGVDLTAQTVDKIENTIQELITKEKISEKEGKKIVDKILKKTEERKDYLEKKINKVLVDLKIKNPKKGIKNLLSKEELEETLHLEEV